MSFIRARVLFAVLLVLFCTAITATAQQREISVLVGRVKTGDKGIQGLQTVEAAFDGAVSYEITYGRRFVDGQIAALYGEFLIMGAPRTGIKSSNVLLPRSYSSIFFTPGLKLQLFPGAGLSPYIAAGLGVGRYNASDTAINGQPATGDTSNTTWAFDYGGGVDVNVIRYFAIRGEVRDFISGTPKLSAPFFDKRQHNVNVAIGLVFKF